MKRAKGYYWVPSKKSWIQTSSPNCHAHPWLSALSLKHCSALLVDLRHVLGEAVDDAALSNDFCKRAWCPASGLSRALAST